MPRTALSSWRGSQLAPEQARAGRGARGRLRGLLGLRESVPASGPGPVGANTLPSPVRPPSCPAGPGPWGPRPQEQRRRGPPSSGARVGLSSGRRRRAAPAGAAAARRALARPAAGCTARRRPLPLPLLYCTSPHFSEAAPFTRGRVCAGDRCWRRWGPPRGAQSLAAESSSWGGWVGCQASGLANRGGAGAACARLRGGRGAPRARAPWPPLPGAPRSRALQCGGRCRGGAGGGGRARPPASHVELCDPLDLLSEGGVLLLGRRKLLGGLGETGEEREAGWAG
jgi:hypothetical protein